MAGATVRKEGERLLYAVDTRHEPTAEFVYSNDPLWEAERLGLLPRVVQSVENDADLRQRAHEAESICVFLDLSDPTEKGDSIRVTSYAEGDKSGHTFAGESEADKLERSSDLAHGAERVAPTCRVDRCRSSAARFGSLIAIRRMIWMGLIGLAALAALGRLLLAC